MAEFLGNAASGQLLALLAIPLCGAGFFAAFLAYSFSKRRQKSKMKLGTSPKRDDSTVESVSKKDAADLDVSVLSQPKPIDEPVAEIKLGRPSPPRTTLNALAEPLAPTPEPEPLPRRQKEWSPEPPEPEENVDLAARLGAQSPRPVPRPSPELELLRLLRHPESGELVVEVAGQPYHKLTDIPDKDMGRYILKLTANLLSFTNGMIETEAGLKSVYNPKLDITPKPLTGSPPVAPAPKRPTPVDPTPPLAPVQPERSSGPPKPPPETEAALLAALTASPPSQPPPTPRRGLLGRTRTSAQPIMPGLNLAEEINKIVQARLIVSPLAATTKIEITSDLGGGIRIKVNGIPYASPDEVPDTEVRELIKASIKQWERS